MTRIRSQEFANLPEEIRVQLQRVEQLEQALSDLVRECRCSVAHPVRPEPFSEAMERADRILTH